MKLPVDQNAAVSFFWVGDLENPWREPMNFYGTSAANAKSHTVSVEHEPASRGIETWITASEMQTLIDKFEQAQPRWVDSKAVKAFGPWEKPKDGYHIHKLLKVHWL